MVRRCGGNGSTAKLAVRPEYLRVEQSGSGIDAVVEEVSFKGDSVSLLLSSHLGELKVKSRDSDAHRQLKLGERVGLSADWSRCTLFAD